MNSEACWITLNKRQFVLNAQYIKKWLNPGVKLAAVVKSNAYGHGLIPFSQMCQESAFVDVLIVFNLSDALVLRKNGVTKRIVVMGFFDGPLSEIVGKDIEITVYNHFLAQEVLAFANNIRQIIRVHVKIDTGMTRLGFSVNEACDVISFLRKSPYLFVAGICTHFADAESEDHSFTLQQIASFKNVLSSVGFVECIHISNTAGVLSFRDAHCSMVRCGGGLYGLGISSGSLLKPIISFKTKIIDIRRINAGCFVGYGKTFVALSERKIAVVPVGYADGLDRSLSNGGSMIVKGCKVPIVGRVAMNMTTLDVTDVLGVCIDDEALIIGDVDGVRPMDHARLLKTIEYEVTTRLNQAIQRISIGG